MFKRIDHARDRHRRARSNPAVFIAKWPDDVLWRLSVPVSLPPSQRAPAGSRPTAVCPINPPDAKPVAPCSAAGSSTSFYEELMRPSGCLLASKNASIGGGC